MYYKTRGIRIKVIRTDDYTTFKSRQVRSYYAKHGIERQSLGYPPYQHWQNSVERDIQTMIHNISAVIHGALLMCEMGFYLGDKKGMKGECHVYQPYYHKILTRGDVHRVRISEIELMEWYGKREHVRQSGLLSWGMVEKAIIDLLKDKPYMNASAPRRTSKIPPTTATGKTRDRCNRQCQIKQPEQLHPNTIVLTVETRHDLSRSFEPKPDVHPPANGNGQQAISRNRTTKASPYGKRTTSLSEA